MKFKVSFPNGTIQTVSDINWFIDKYSKCGYHVSVSRVSLKKNVTYLYLVKIDSI